MTDTVLDYPYKCGKGEAIRPHGLAELPLYLTRKPPMPRATVPVPSVAGWPMMGNAQYGDCVFAGWYHEVQTANALVGTHDALPTEAQLIKRYLQLSPGDQGLVISTFLQLWQQKGIFDNRIKGYGPVAQTIGGLQLCVDLFGFCKVGIQCPLSMQQEFAAGQPITVVKGSQILGGHDIEAVAYDHGGVWCVTWGGLAYVTYPFLHAFVDEAWGVITQEYVEKGRGPNLDIEALEQDMPLLQGA